MKSLFEETTYNEVKHALISSQTSIDLAGVR